MFQQEKPKLTAAQRNFKARLVRIKNSIEVNRIDVSAICDNDIRALNSVLDSVENQVNILKHKPRGRGRPRFDL